MNNHMSLKLVGANSSLELNSPITSIYLQEELTGLTTLPGIRETKGMNIGMNGGWTSAQFYEPRLITIKGVIANQDVAVVEQRRKQLIQLLAEKRLALEFQTEASNHYTMNVVVAGLQMPLSKVLTATFFQLNLRADDPLIYDNNALAELEAILRRSSSASSGFSINFPINFQLGVSESRPTIDNFGSSVVYPVITLTGPLTTPEIVNITTNMAFTIDEVLSAGAYTLSGIRGVMTQEGTVETASGSAFQITGIEGAPLTLTELTGNATQNGTPTPDSPVPISVVTGENVVRITGKNLFPNITWTPRVAYPVAQSGGIAWWTGYCGFQDYVSVLPNTTYTFSNAENIGFTYGLQFYDSNKTWISGINNRTKTFTTPANCRYIRGSTDIATAPTNCQLELGSTATAYEPYQGQTLPVNLTSKNLFDGEIEQGGFTGTGLNNPASNRIRTTNYIPVSPNTEYSIKVNNFNTSLGSVSGVNVSYYAVADYSTARISEKGWQTASGDNVATFTTPANCHYIRFLLSIGSTASGGSNLTPSDVSQVQLEKGDSVSSYEAYWKIELAGIGTYQDRIYKNDGKWYIEKQIGKHTLDGSENFGRLQIGSTGKYYFSLTPAPQWGQQTTSGKTFMSDHFTPNNTWAEQAVGAWLDVNLIIKTAGSLDGTQSVADFKTWLTSNNTTFYYALATPTTTEITDSTLLSQLNFIANLYGGTNNIMLVGTGAQGEIEVRTGQIIGVIDSLSIVGTSGSIDINLNGSELAAVGSVTDELAINGTTGAVTKTARIGKIASYAGESITTDYISTTGGLDTGATVYYVLPSSSTSTLSTLDSTALASFNGIVASGGVSAQTNIGSISVDVTTLSAQDVAVVDTKQHTVTINGVGAYSKFSGDWLTLDVGLNELQLITENNTDTGSAVIKYRVGYMGV